MGMFFAYDETNHSEQENLTLKSRLIPGYNIADGKIICEQSQKAVDDISALALNFSARAVNAIGRGMHIKKGEIANFLVSDLLLLSAEQLIEVPNIGAKTVNEIISVIKEYCDTGIVSKDESNKHNSNEILAPGYTVLNGKILNQDRNMFIGDAPISVLNLSTRSGNWLRCSRKNMISDLIGLSFDELTAIKNIGMMAANEIEEKLKIYLDSSLENFKEIEHKNKEPLSKMVIALFEEHEFCALSFEDILQKFEEFDKDTVQAVLNQLVSEGKIESKDDRYTLKDLEEAKYKSEELSSKKILALFEEHEFCALSFEDVLQKFEEFDKDTVQAVLNQLVSDGKIESENNMYTFPRISFFDYIATELDERSASALKMRAERKTLNETGLQFGITKERVRQIENNIFRRIAFSNLRFKEDEYAYAFCKYNFDKDFFANEIGDSKLLYYLDGRYERGYQKAEIALEDKLLSADFRIHVSNYLHKGEVKIDGQYVNALRSDIEDYIVERYCRETIAVEDYFALYDRILDENGITDERFRHNKESLRGRINKFARSENILWTHNQKFRYYDIKGTDFTELLETLSLEKYKNTEISTRKFLLNYPEIMSQYDLRDEYEIHNLLKKIHAEKRNPNMVFSRMPTIVFGEFDRSKAVKEFLFAMAPVSIDDLADAISEEYGVRSDSVKADWLGCISEYFHNGNYSVDYEEMAPENIKTLKSKLKDDFYFMSELRDIYMQTIPNADLSLLSTYNLKKMGFIVGTTYVIQHYPTTDAYFRSLLTSENVVNIKPINREYGTLSSYSSCLSKLKNDLEIIEFEPDLYINIHYFKKFNLDKADFKAYADRVLCFLSKDEYFTIQSIRDAGFVDKLDFLNLGTLFFSSILKTDNRFSWAKIGGTIVFSQKKEAFFTQDFLVDKVAEDCSIGAADLANKLKKNYGIVIDKYDIVEKLKGSNIYYDSITKKLYANYDALFENG